MSFFRNILLLVPILFSLYSPAQKISNVDFDIIKREVTDSNSIFFYPKLIKRYKNADSTLSFIDFQHLYYGSVFQPNYSPYGHTESADKFYELYKNEKFKKALKAGEKAFAENPVNMTLVFRLAVTHLALGNKNQARKLADLYYKIMDVILSSGDGQSIQSAYVVISVADEYEIVAEHKLQVKKQQLIGHTDVLTFDKKSQKNRKKKIKALYFDVTFPLNYLANSFKNIDIDTNKE